LNPKTIKQLRKFITFLKSNPRVLENFKNPWEIFECHFEMMQVS
jgi:hypothetical protein